MLSVLPFVIIISTFIIFRAAEKSKIISIAFLLITTIVSVSYCLRKKPVNDHSPGFTDGIAVTQNAIHYCEEEKMYDKKMYSNFLMRMHLTHPEHGYLAARKEFSNVSDTLDEAVRICLFSSYELDEPLYNTLKREDSFKLIKRFEKNYAWCEVYEKIN
jgi:hypothetical protein